MLYSIDKSRFLGGDYCVALEVLEVALEEHKPTEVERDKGKGFLAKQLEWAKLWDRKVGYRWEGVNQWV